MAAWENAIASAWPTRPTISGPSSPGTSPAAPLSVSLQTSDSTATAMDFYSGSCFRMRSSNSSLKSGVNSEYSTVRMRRSALVFLILGLAGILVAEAGDGEVLHKGPPNDRAHPTPFALDPNSPAPVANIL